MGGVVASCSCAVNVAPFRPKRPKRPSRWSERAARRQTKGRAPTQDNFSREERRLYLSWISRGTSRAAGLAVPSTAIATCVTAGGWSAFTRLSWPAAAPVSHPKTILTSNPSLPVQTVSVGGAEPRRPVRDVLNRIPSMGGGGKNKTVVRRSRYPETFEKHIVKRCQKLISFVRRVSSFLRCRSTNVGRGGGVCVGRLTSGAVVARARCNLSISSLFTSLFSFFLNYLKCYLSNKEI